CGHKRLHVDYRTRKHCLLQRDTAPADQAPGGRFGPASVYVMRTYFPTAQSGEVGFNRVHPRRESVMGESDPFLSQQARGRWTAGAPRTTPLSLVTRNRTKKDGDESPSLGHQVISRRLKSSRAA